MYRNSRILNWQSVLLVKVTREPFTGTHYGLHISRAHLALHPDGVVCSAWDIPLARLYPYDGRKKKNGVSYL